MPWLSRPDSPGVGQALLYVHVPRAGGTSLLRSFDVLRKSREGAPCLVRGARCYYDYRYRVIEASNFPWRTWENLWALFLIILGSALFLFEVSYRIDEPHYRPAFSLWTCGSLTALVSTFVVTAPACRLWPVRRFILCMASWLTCECVADLRWLVGMSIRGGFLQHLTASDMIALGYVSESQFADPAVVSFALVRNPYSRMVSMYAYNRFGPLEGFGTFVKRWEKSVMRAEQHSHTREWDVYAHVLPQRTFTHDPATGKQIVQSVVRLEDLNLDLCMLPAALRSALDGLIRRNARLGAGRETDWRAMYTPETAAAVLRMYHQDFVAFGYLTESPCRSQSRALLVC